MTLATGVEFELASAAWPNGLQLQALLDLYLDELVPYIALEYRPHQKPDGHWPYQEWEASSPKLETWLFRYRAAPAGFIFGEALPEGLYIRELFVAAGYRRLGVGTAAVRVLQESVQRGRYRGLLAMIYAANHTAIAFWQTLGFECRPAPAPSPPYPPGLGVWTWPKGAYVDVPQALPADD